LKRQGFVGLNFLLRFQQPNLVRDEINLYHAASKEIRAHKSVHGLFTRTAQPLQIHRQILVGQFHVANSGRHAFLPVTGEHGLHTVHHDFPPEFQPDSFRRAQVDDADSSASVHEEIEWLLRLRDVDFDPQQALTKLKGEFGE
jgi:hypothetical protein